MIDKENVIKIIETAVSNKEYVQIIYEAYIQAIEIGKIDGFKIGQVIGHPLEEKAYEIKEINSNEVTVWYNMDINTIKILPLNEIFDANLARDIAISRKIK